MNLVKCKCGETPEIIIVTGTCYTISYPKCIAGVTFRTKGEAERAWNAQVKESRG